MKKRILSIALFAIFTLALAFALTACGGSCEDGKHSFEVYSGVSLDSVSEWAKENDQELYNAILAQNWKVLEEYHTLHCTVCHHHEARKHNYKAEQSKGADKATIHNLVCTDCDTQRTEEHELNADNKCVCGYEKPQFTVYALNSNDPPAWGAKINNDAKGDLVIPDSYTNEYGDERIIIEVKGSADADQRLPNLTSLTLGDNVTYCNIRSDGLVKITASGECRFYGLDTPNLKELNAPKGHFESYLGTSLKSFETMVIGTISDSNHSNPAFKNLTEYPENLTVTVNKAIGAYVWAPAFAKTVNLGESITEIDFFCRYTASGVPHLIETVNAPGLVKTGEYGTFASDRTPNLKTINAPNLEIIGEGTFSGLDELKSVSFPKVTQIGNYAFSGTGIESMSLPSTVTKLGSGVFSDCHYLKSLYYNVITVDANCYLFAGEVGKNADGGLTVTIGKDVKVIPDNCFNSSKYVTSLVFEEGCALEEIGYSAFSAIGAETVTLPSTVKKIGSYAFAHSDTLKTINMPLGVDMSELVIYGCSQYVYESDAQGTYFGSVMMSINEGVTELRPRAGTVAFKEHITAPDSVISVVLPDSFLRLPSESRLPFANATSITLSPAIKLIPMCCFMDCEKLESITLPEGLEIIDGYAFQGLTNLESLTIPASVTAIGDSAFSNCTSLSTITVLGDVELTPNMVWGSAYKGEQYGNGYYMGTTLMGVVDPEKFLYVKDGTTAIHSDAFDGVTTLKYVYVPESVTEYQRGLFNDCTGLTLILEGPMSSMTQTGATNVRFNKDVTEDGFEYSASSSGVTITKYFGEETELVFPSTIEDKHVIVIGDGEVIADHIDITSVTLPATTTKIGGGAFMNNTSLASINLPATVYVIGDSAFRGCSSLAAVDVQGSGFQIYDNYSIPGVDAPVATVAINDTGFITKLTSTYGNGYQWVRNLNFG